MTLVIPEDFPVAGNETPPPPKKKNLLDNRSLDRALNADPMEYESGEEPALPQSSLSGNFDLSCFRQ